MEDALNRHMAEAGEPEIFIERLYEEVEAFTRGAPQSDDITMVYLSR